MPGLSSQNDVLIRDVGPRDGLQNQTRMLDSGQRLTLIESLLNAGLRHIEVGAFVSPVAVPAMKDTDQVVQGLPELEGAEFSVLIPNTRGFELAIEAGARFVAMVLYASESMAQRNAKMSRSEAEQATIQILRRAKSVGVKVAATISVAFECPYDGPTPVSVVESIAERFLDQGVDELVIADTIGAADPRQVSGLMEELVGQHGHERLTCHFHDTRALGQANVYAALETGIRRFDASIGGLGGCPFAPGASGNVATEDVAMMMHMMNLETGIDLPKLVKAVDVARELTGTAPGGKSMPWLRQSLSRQEHRP